MWCFIPQGVVASGIEAIWPSKHPRALLVRRPATERAFSCLGWLGDVVTGSRRFLVTLHFLFDAVRQLFDFFRFLDHVD